MRSPSCEIRIPELDLTLPATKRGQLTTVEGLVRDVVSDLSMDQPLRRIQDEEGYNTIQALVEKLKAILGHQEDEDATDGKEVVKAADKDVPMSAFTLKLDDPAGNSWIEFIGNMSDPKWNMRRYPRTLQQNIDLGLVAAEDEPAEEELQTIKEGTEVNGAVTDDEVFVFHGHCSSCGHPLDTLMKKVKIPYFKVCLPFVSETLSLTS